MKTGEGSGVVSAGDGTTCSPQSAANNLTRRSLVAAVPVLAAGCSAVPKAPPNDGLLAARPTPSPPLPSARHGSFRLDGAANAAVLIPASYDPAKPAPFALVLHGATGKGEPILRRFASLAERYGVILLAPDSDDYTWDLIVGVGRARPNDPEPRFGADTARIDEALRLVFDRFAIDPDRAAAMGMSDGASYALSLGVRNPELFRSVAAFSPGHIVSPAGGGPRVFIAHGRQDKVLAVTTTTMGIAPLLRRTGHDVQVELFNGGHELRPDMMKAAFEWWLGPERSVVEER